MAGIMQGGGDGLQNGRAEGFYARGIRSIPGLWAKRISDGLIYCPFPKCVKGELPTGQKRKGREKLNG